MKKQYILLFLLGTMFSMQVSAQTTEKWGDKTIAIIGKEICRFRVLKNNFTDVCYVDVMDGKLTYTLVEFNQTLLVYLEIITCKLDDLEHSRCTLSSMNLSSIYEPGNLWVIYLKSKEGIKGISTQVYDSPGNDGHFLYSASSKMNFMHYQDAEKFKTSYLPE